MHHKSTGFTLAEVLITLSVIGVVAAMTIPTLYANTKQKQYDVKFQKAYSTLLQANRMTQAQYEWTFSDINSACGQNPAAEKPEEKLTLCAMFNGTLKGSTYLGKLSDLKDTNDNFYWGDGVKDYIAYAIADGTIVAFNPNIQSTDLDYRIFVDVNGTSLPNNAYYSESSSIRDTDMAEEMMGLLIPPAYALSSGFQINRDDTAGLYQQLPTKKGLHDVYPLYFSKGELRTF